MVNLIKKASVNKMNILYLNNTFYVTITFKSIMTGLAKDVSRVDKTNLLYLNNTFEYYCNIKIY